MALETDLSAPLRAVAADLDWDAVYAEHLPKVYNFFRYQLRNDAVAQDLTSVTFEKAWAARSRYRRDLAGFGTWLLAIARNAAIDHHRSHREHALLDDVDPAIDPSSPEEDETLTSDRKRLAALLATLPERDRELLALKYGAGATNRAIATITGLSETNVGTIIHRAVQTLRRDW